jgi:hypothetical protein
MNEVPPHFHKTDRISETDIIPDSRIGTLPERAEEGRWAVVKNGSTYDVYRYLDGDWRQVGGILVNDTRYYTKAQIDTALTGKSDTGHSHTSSDISDFNESVDDRVAALLVEGDNVTLTYDDSSNTLTISVPTAGGTKIYVTTSNVSVSNTTTETDLLNTTIPGGTLDTNNGIKARLFFDQLENVTAGNDVLKVYYGSTVVAQASVDITSTSKQGYLDILLFGNGATNAQQASMQGIFANVNTEATNNTILNMVGSGTATEDSTASKTFRVTFKWANANAGNVIRLKHAVVEKIV